MPTQPTMVESAWFVSPLGVLRLDASARGLRRIAFGEPRPSRATPRPRHEALRLALDELRRFFAGKPKPSEVPFDLSAGTPFQRAVWTALARTVLPGELVTYGELASRAGRPGAARAVGAAMGKNPIPILVPCHRVVAAGARPGGFGLGLHVKQALLACEGALLPGFDAS